MRYITLVWKKEWQKAAFSAVKALWESYREKAPLTVSILLYKVDLAPQEKELDEFNRIKKEMDEKTTRPASQDEYEDYCAKVPYDIKVTPI